MVVYTGKDIVHFRFNGKKFCLGGALRLELDAPLLPIDYPESTQEDLVYLWNNFPNANKFLKLVEDRKETALVKDETDLEINENEKEDVIHTSKSKAANRTSKPTTK